MITAIQGTIAVIAPLVLMLAPPASGKMLVVPLSGQGSGGVVRAALSGGARLIGAGPLPGSMVVFGNRGRIAGAGAFGWTVVLAAPPAGCSDATTAGAAA